LIKREQDEKLAILKAEENQVLKSIINTKKELELLKLEIGKIEKKKEQD